MEIVGRPEHQACRGAIGNTEPPGADLAHEQEWRRAKARYNRRDHGRQKYRADSGLHRRSPVANVAAGFAPDVADDHNVTLDAYQRKLRQPLAAAAALRVVRRLGGLARWHSQSRSQDSRDRQR